MLRRFLFLPLFAVAGSALADVSFKQNHSDTRTLLQDLGGVGVSGEYWDSHLSYENNGGADLFLNGIEVVPGAGFDPNIRYTAPIASIDYADNFSGQNGTYTFGTAIADGTEWDLRRILEFDVFNSTSAALGTYDLTVNFLGGADPAATDALGSLDLYVEVFGKLDLTVTGTATDIDAAHPTSFLTMTVQNNMAKDFRSTTWFIRNYSTDPNDPNAPTLTGSFYDSGNDLYGDWFDKTVAPGDSRTDRHSNWDLNATSTLGVYHGDSGVIGGLYNGDNYLISMAPTPDIRVQSVPEPASLAILGIGALGFLRRRK